MEVLNNCYVFGTKRVPLSGLSDRNKNVLICGTTGSGKTTSFELTTLFSTKGDNASNYVIVDPKGTIYKDTAMFFRNQGYVIQYFDLKNVSKSQTYNPFMYCDNLDDVVSLIHSLVTKGQSSDVFWEKSEECLLQAICFYLFNKCNKEDQTLANVNKLLLLHEVSDDCSHKSTLDLLFEKYSEEKPNNVAVQQYQKFKQAADKTQSSILATCHADMFQFSLDPIKRLTNSNTINFKEFSNPENKVILYIVLDDKDSKYDKIGEIFINQLIQALFRYADKSTNYSLSRNVTLFLDDAGTYKIKDIQKTISTCRSRNINMVLMVQGEEQLDAIYGEKVKESIVSCCDYYLYLGSNSPYTWQRASDRFDMPYSKIVNLPLKKIIVYERGNKSQIMDRYDIFHDKTYLKYVKKHCHFK